MSSNLKKQIHLVDFIVNDQTSDSQTKAVLQHLTNQQRRAIREVLLNILAENLEIELVWLKKFSKQQQVFRKLSRAKSSQEFDRHYKLVRDILRAVHTQLSTILKQ